MGVVSRDPGISRRAVVSAVRLREAMRRFEARTEEVAREHGITPMRYVLLLTIEASTERPTVTELAERLILTSQSVAELTARSEQAGLIYREPSEDDGRVSHLTLTPKAVECLGSVFRTLEPDRLLLLQSLQKLS